MCYRSHCHVQYQRCVQVFGDGCFCYPGLLQCLQTACTSFYQTAVDQCLEQQVQPARCIVRCHAQRYPVAFSTETSPSPSGRATNVTNDTIVFIDDSYAFDDNAEYTVVVVLYVEATTAALLQDADYEIATAIAGVPSSKEYFDVSNVTLTFQDILVNDTAPVLEVTASIALSSFKAMQATDTMFQAMMLGNSNSTFGAQLVDAHVLFDPAQVSVADVKSDVSFASDDNAQEIPGNGGGIPSYVSPRTIVVAVLLLLV
ncbi:hypothetical protein DYB28_006600 [Aphanomyces astaci]|uniref:Uncharacterized protein n=1 Tax=Aphanomyces astaci TaxID=112090 RepID=A0A397EDY0_APHAT|nr:hypothetical protein DYB30_005087 [Aphanomyces astaci]RHZ13243.1 hypothetical protein DYB26_014070 [Aphanomyces astaci]RLO00439.1 hypothetical protein DYB28_006600 [Aphanomyces astaci]